LITGRGKSRWLGFTCNALCELAPAKHVSPEGDGAENTRADSHEQITLFYAVLHENVTFYGLKMNVIILLIQIDKARTYEGAGQIQTNLSVESAYPWRRRKAGISSWSSSMERAWTRP
jgi:hypothetical protein